MRCLAAAGGAVGFGLGEWSGLAAAESQPAAYLAPRTRRLHFSNSQTVSGPKNRHCERSEAIHRAASKKAGLLRCARNDDEMRLLDLAAGLARVFPEILTLFHQRAQGMPGARCAR